MVMNGLNIKSVKIEQFSPEEISSIELAILMLKFTFLSIDIDCNNSISTILIGKQWMLVKDSVCGIFDDSNTLFSGKEI